MNIPKESSPSIKLGIISIATVYPGTNPQDIDSLITDKIYKEVKDIKWIDKIESTSSLGVSSVVITLKTDAVVQDVLDEVRSNVARVSLPDDALDPNIQEIETDTSRAFSILIYDEDNSKSRSYLLDKAKQIQDHLKWTPGIESVDIWYSSDSSPIAGGAGWVDAYDVEIVLEKEKIDALGIDLSTIANAIKSLNLDLPIGNFSLGDKQYDYRISGKNTSSFEFLSTPISLANGGTITLGEISRIERDYASTTRDLVIIGDTGSGKEYIGLTINKSDGYSIFAASDAAKKNIEEIFDTPEFSGLGFIYGSDLAETIREDYKALAREATTTLVLVFIVIYLFVGFKEAVFASVTLPLAFLATFILLYAMGYSLNFLTNFSLILSFGIAIDTIIVIVQAASSKIKIGYNPKSAILLAINEYAIPIISGVATTIVVFVPMMTLPGILGKFLAYIPITIFGVLTFGLILALTVNSALYLLFTRRQNTYRENEEILEYANKDERELLQIEREWKTKIADNERSLRMQIIEAMINSYKRVLKKFLMNKRLRRQSILIPVVFFFVGSFLLAPRVGFELFPSDDNNIVNFSIEWTPGITTEKMAEMVWDIAPLFAGYKEIKTISISTSKNKTSISTELILKDTRKELWLMSVYDFEKEVLHKLAPLESKWLKVTSEPLANGPPGGKATKGRVGEHHVDPVVRAVVAQRAHQGVVVPHLAGHLDAVQHQVGDAQHVGHLLLFHAADAVLQHRFLLGVLHLSAQVLDRTDQKAAGAGSRVHYHLAETGVDLIDHELRHRARGVELAGVASGLQVLQQLFVEVVEQMPLALAVEVDAVELVDHLAQQVAALHVVVGILEHAAHHVAARVALGVARQLLERHEQLGVDEVEQVVAGDALGVGRPVAPAHAGRDRAGVFVAGQFQFFFQRIEDFQEQQPGQLRDALRVAIHAGVLAHDVLDGFDDGGEVGHTGDSRFRYLAMAGQIVQWLAGAYSSRSSARMAPRNCGRPPKLRTSSTGLPMLMKGWILNTSLLSIAVMPSSAYLSSSASSTLRATGPYSLKTLRCLTRRARSLRVR